MIRLLLVVLVIGGMTAIILKQNTGPTRPEGTEGTLYQTELDKARGVEDMLLEATQNRKDEMP